jgi:hypothetical protein
VRSCASTDKRDQRACKKKLEKRWYFHGGILTGTAWIRQAGNGAQVARNDCKKLRG